MKNIILISALLTIIFVKAQSTYYVTNTGSSGNNGTSEGSAWSLSHAFSTATAGDIVYIKAGLYTGYNITQNNNGTSANPIKFIGYKTSINDIDEDAQLDFTLGTQTVKVLAGFEYGDTINANEMPLMQESSTTSTALNITGDYVHVYNFQIQNYGAAIYGNGDYCVFKNLICIDQGNQTSRVSEGFSANNIGDYNDWKNIYVENGGQQGFRTINGNNNNFDAVTVTCNNNVNATDYYFLLENGSNNTATNIYVKRVGNIEHYGHGIVFKDANPVTNNLVDGFIIDNTVLEPQFPGVHSNTFKNGYIIIRPDSWGAQNHCGMTLANGSYDNTFENIYLKDAPIRFADWQDGRGGDVAEGSNGNEFSQITMDLTNRIQPAIRFNFFTTGGVASFGSSNNNTFYNCTFYNGDYLYEDSRDNSNTSFVNCIFDNFSTFKTTQGGGTSYGIDANYTSCNFSNLGFTTPTGTNITTVNPQFTDVNNYDFSLGQGNALLGQGVATPFLAAGNDIGAFQSNVSTISVTSVSVSPSIANISVGNTVQLTESVSPSNASDKTGIWSSNNGNATVDQNGLVTGVSGGSATITFTTTDGSFTDTTVVNIVVSAPPPNTINTSKRTLINKIIKI